MMFSKFSWLLGSILFCGGGWWVCFVRCTLNNFFFYNFCIVYYDNLYVVPWVGNCHPQIANCLLNCVICQNNRWWICQLRIGIIVAFCDFIKKKTLKCIKNTVFMHFAVSYTLCGTFKKGNMTDHAGPWLCYLWVSIRN